MRFLCKREKRSETGVKVLTKAENVWYYRYVGALKRRLFLFGMRNSEFHPTLYPRGWQCYGLMKLCKNQGRCKKLVFLHLPFSHSSRGITFLKKVIKKLYRYYISPNANLIFVRRLLSVLTVPVNSKFSPLISFISPLSETLKILYVMCAGSSS